MHAHIIAVGAFEVNCTLFYTDTRQAWICDPGGDAEKIEALLHQRRLQVAGYVLTHGHLDHLGALETLLASHPGPVHLHPADAAWAFTPLNCIPPYPTPSGAPARLCPDLTDGFTGLDGGPRLQVLETPGHTPGSVCLIFPDAKLMLSGDTLFAGSVGRTDLPGGNGRALTQSLKRLQRLTPELRVIPGHGPETTLERERRCNPFLARLPETAP